MLLDLIVNKAIIIMRRNRYAYFAGKTSESNADWHSGIK